MVDYFVIGGLMSFCLGILAMAFVMMLSTPAKKPKERPRKPPELPITAEHERRIRALEADGVADRVTISVCRRDIKTLSENVLEIKKQRKNEILESAPALPRSIPVGLRDRSDITKPGRNPKRRR